MKKIFFFVFSCLIIFSAASAVSAQSLGIKISPTKIEDIVDPGGVYNYSIKITNPSDTSIRLYAYLKDFKASGEGGDPILIAPGSEDGYFLASWIDITGEGIDFKPGEEKKISFTVNVPPETGPGGYYGGVFFGTQAPKLNIESEDKGAGMAISQQTGSLVLLQVKGDALEEASIREFNTDREFYGTPYEVNFTTRIENKGNVHVKPQGQISIENLFGEEVAAIRVNEAGGNILPGQIRRFDNSWEGSMGFGRYKAVIGLSYGTSVDLGGQGKQTLYTEKYFWIMPWKIILPVLSTVAFLFILLAVFLRLYRNKAVRSAMAQAGLGHVKYVKKYQAPSPIAHIFMILIVVLIVVFLLISGFYFLFMS